MLLRTESMLLDVSKKMILPFLQITRKQNLSQAKSTRVGSSKPHLSLLSDLPINFKMFDFYPKQIIFKTPKKLKRTNKKFGA